MNGFVQFTDDAGGKHLVSIDHIIRVHSHPCSPTKCTIYLEGGHQPVIAASLETVKNGLRLNIESCRRKELEDATT